MEGFCEIIQEKARDCKCKGKKLGKKKPSLRKTCCVPDWTAELVQRRDESLADSLRKPFIELPDYCTCPKRRRSKVVKPPVIINLEEEIPFKEKIPHRVRVPPAGEDKIIINKSSSSSDTNIEKDKKKINKDNNNKKKRKTKKKIVEKKRKSNEKRVTIVEEDKTEEDIPPPPPRKLKEKKRKSDPPMLEYEPPPVKYKRPPDEHRRSSDPPFPIIRPPDPPKPRRSRDKTRRSVDPPPPKRRSTDIPPKDVPKIRKSIDEPPKDVPKIRQSIDEPPKDPDKTRKRLDEPPKEPPKSCKPPADSDSECSESDYIPPRRPCSSPGYPCMPWKFVCCKLYESEPDCRLKFKPRYEYACKKPCQPLVNTKLTTCVSKSGTYESIFKLLRSSFKCSDRVLLMTPRGSFAVFRAYRHVYYVYDGTVTDINAIRNRNIYKDTSGFLCFQNMHRAVMYISILVDAREIRSSFLKSAKSIVKEICVHCFRTKVSQKIC